jgi:nucleotide-binding universal stress UspA family protein
VSRIVVGIDSSSGSRAALRWALRYAAVTGSEIDAVLAYDSGLAWIDVGSDYESSWTEHAARNAREQLARVLDEVAPEPRSVTIRATAVESPPSEALVELARDADALVVGTRGRGGFAGLLMGSVSQRCVERAPCPVVVVPESSGTAGDSRT